MFYVILLCSGLGQNAAKSDYEIFQELSSKMCHLQVNLVNEIGISEIRARGGGGGWSITVSIYGAKFVYFQPFQLRFC